MADEPKREFRASARNVRMSARKARLVMDAVRGRDAQDAMVLLSFVNKRAAPAIRKLIESAMANAEEYSNREGVPVDAAELVIADAQVDEGTRLKRWRPRSRGSATPFTRYTCHMRVTLAERAWLDERAKGRPAFMKPRRRLSKEQRLAKKGIFLEKAEPESTTPAAEKAAGAETPKSKAEAPAKKKAKPATKPKKETTSKTKSGAKPKTKKTEKKGAKKAPAKKKK
jgi:large subunit ribosomal protein L22